MIASQSKFRLQFIQKSEKISIQVFRYVFAGGFSFIVDSIVMLFLTEYLHIYYLISTSIGFFVGLIVNYILSIYWVFYKRSINKLYIEIIIFSFIAVIGLLLNGFFVWFFTEYVYFHYFISKIFAAVRVFSWNFSVKKFILFH